MYDFELIKSLNWRKLKLFSFLLQVRNENSKWPGSFSSNFSTSETVVILVVIRILFSTKYVDRIR